MSLDEEEILKAGADMKHFDNMKFSLYCKYLNILLLKTGDPFIAKKYEKYL